ncbi:glycerol dehydrogenase [Paraburkholderia unamae]|uniref:Glycerol dehydrogenase n=1 Tax=Paraburkholderia unamae TaxID=219649 RepID=A0ABX5KF19_9BURK|nr:glycerol dehydrogenase [Paraburkholderia unamae]PVX71413.1 glycerol dehydrogenase [Paraburkholderia unamae]CAG9275003.1 Glycerol dehydrogenase [Paraburkholderia unamae]
MSAATETTAGASAPPWRTIGFPGRYVQGPGALAALGPVLAELGARRACTILDASVAATLAPAVDATLAGAGVSRTRVDFAHECTAATIAALTEAARAFQADAIVTIGGGKAIDSAKGAARARRLPIVVCPSAASSDAPTSRLIVRYDEQHRVAGVDMLARNPDAVIVDTDVIARAPKRLFAAGIGDALSKFFEVAQCERAQGTNGFGTRALPTALRMAAQTRETLYAAGAQAWRDVSEGRLTEAVEQVVEATVLHSGIGFESGGLSLAHALIRGLTAVPAMAANLHGELVAFGTLVQLFVENAPQTEIERLATLLDAVELPLTLAQLGQPAALTRQQAATLADATLAASYSRHMTPPLTAPRLLEGLARADAFGRAWRARVDPARSH